MRKLKFTACRNISTIGLFHHYLLVLCVSIGSLAVTGCANKASKPNQTLLNRPNTIIARSYDDLDNHPPLDPQRTSRIGTTRPVRAIEYTAYGLDGAIMWVTTADVIKAANADLLADYGMPTGRWQKMEFDSGYACFSEPLNVKGNIIRYRATGTRDGGRAGEHQLTLTVNNHNSLPEAKRVFVEKVEAICNYIDGGMEPVIRHRILNEQFVYRPDDQTASGRLRAADGWTTDQWQPAPDPGFRYHRFRTHYWRLPFDHGGNAYTGDVSLHREPLSENGYKWGDPFVIRVIFKPRYYP